MTGGSSSTGGREIDEIEALGFELENELRSSSVGHRTRLFSRRTTSRTRTEKPAALPSYSGRLRDGADPPPWDPLDRDQILLHGKLCCRFYNQKIRESQLKEDKKKKPPPTPSTPSASSSTPKLLFDLSIWL